MTSPLPPRARQRRRPRRPGCRPRPELRPVLPGEKVPAGEAAQLAAQPPQRPRPLGGVAPGRGPRLLGDGAVLGGPGGAHRLGDRPFLGGAGWGGQPHRGRTTRFPDFLGQPVELLARAGIGGQRD